MNRTSLPPIVRYRDNFLVLVLQHALHGLSPAEFIQQVKSRVQTSLAMQLTVEAVSRNLPFLEAMVFITSRSTVELTVKPPVFTSQPGESHPPSQKRLLDFFSPNAQDMLSSYVPNQVAKCTHYAFGREVMFLNICCLISLLRSKDYPKQWWKPMVLAKCHTIGLSDLASVALRRSLPECP